MENTSAYDLLQLMQRPELKTEPVKFVNFSKLQQEQDKRIKLKALL
jgi:hypothetical protein